MFNFAFNLALVWPLIFQLTSFVRYVYTMVRDPVKYGPFSWLYWNSGHNSSDTPPLISKTAKIFIYATISFYSNFSD